MTRPDEIGELAEQGRTIMALKVVLEQLRETVREMRAELNSREKRIAELEAEKRELLVRVARYRAGRA
jgi:phage shock protein A